ncbi:MAG: pentapeptide repeat-containing protein [Pseudodonghicola sp.]
MEVLVFSHSFRDVISLGDIQVTDVKITQKSCVDEIWDKKEIVGKRFERCCFVEIGARDARFRDCVFQACTFENVYLKGAAFNNVSFIGSDFERCNFHSARFHDCIFDYTKFIRCHLTPEQVRDNLPSNPSASYRLLRNFYEEARALGNWGDMKQLFFLSKREEDRHSKYIFSSYNEYYKRTYSFPSRVRSFLKYSASVFSRWVWGYGRSPMILVRNLIVFLFLFPWFVYRSSSVSGGAAKFVGDYWDYFRASLVITLPFTSIREEDSILKIVSTTPQWAQATGAVVGLVFFGMFLSILYSRIAGE